MKKEFKVSEVIDIDSTHGVFHACNIKISDTKQPGYHPYVVRTSQNNGIRGYIREDENALNPGETISFAQDTAEIFYQSEPYFTGNKIKVMSLHDKSVKLTEKIAIYLITALKNGFQNFKWGASFDTRLLKDATISLPVMTRAIPDWSALQDICMGVGGISMNEIDTSTWKEFKLDDIFEKYL